MDIEAAIEYPKWTLVGTMILPPKVWNRINIPLSITDPCPPNPFHEKTELFMSYFTGQSDMEGVVRRPGRAIS